MNHHQSSRRQFLKISALLPFSGLLLSPAIANFYEDSSAKVPEQVTTRSAIPRADIRNLDFDSHNFRRNFIVHSM